MLLKHRVKIKQKKKDVTTSISQFIKKQYKKLGQYL
jgi:hypothetical protein